MTHEEFANLIRDAFSHLYDPAYLQRHALAQALVETGEPSLVTRAQRLRNILLNALEQLEPPDSAFGHPESSDCYHALHYRYLDGLSPEQIADLMAMSPRQTYRKIRDGIEAIASLLADRLRRGEAAQFQLESLQGEPAELSAGGQADRRVLAQEAADHLGSYAHAEVIELHAILEDIVRDLQPFCNQIGAEIRLVIPHSPLHLYADRTMLRQAMINLVSSAFNQPTTRLLVIREPSGRAETQSETWLHLDAGSPLGADEPPQDAPRIPNEREDVGLEVAMRLFDLQGIRVKHSSDDGGWHAEIRMDQAAPQRILVIDDMPDVAQLFQRFAKAYAVEIISAGNAEQAYDLLQQVTPRLILLDVMLPRRDGWEILQTLKSDASTAHIPVVVCSVLNEPELATSLGADDTLCKPVSQEAFLKVLSRWLHLDPRPVAAQP